MTQRWIVVADCPFLPAARGGEQEQLGFLRAALREGLVALLVVPSSGELDLAPYRELMQDVPVLVTPRRVSPLAFLHPRTPFVVASRPAPADLVEQARRLAPEATGIVGFHYKSHAVTHALATGLGLPAVLRQHNREGDYHRRLAGQSHGLRALALRLDAIRIAADERRLNAAQWLNGTADISAADAEWRRAAGGRHVVHVPPFALAVRELPAAGATSDRRPEPGRVLFLGSLDTETNTGGLDWFLQHAWPKVRAQVPHAHLDVVGRAPSSALRQRLIGRDDVQLFADVADVTPFVRRASVAINPIVSGSGVNIKLLDYFRDGVAVVSTSIATRGLALRPGTDLLVHDDPAEFADAVTSLLLHDELREQVADAGRERVGQLIDVGAGLRTFERLLAGEHPEASERTDGPVGRLHVVYRSYGGENRKPRPPFYSKMLGLRSALEAAEPLSPAADLVFVNDGPVDPELETVMREHGRIVTARWGSNRASYRAAIAWVRAQGWPGEDLVLFAEDDYLYDPTALEQLMAAARQIPDADYFSLWGHLALDTSSSRRRPRQRPQDLADGDPSAVEVDGVRWYRQLSTTSTFAARVGAVTEDATLLRTVPFVGGAFDHASMLALQGYQPFPWRDVAAMGLAVATGRVAGVGAATRPRAAVKTVMYTVANVLARRQARSGRQLRASDPQLILHMEHPDESRGGTDWAAVAEQVGA